MDLLDDDPKPADNMPEFSVSELSGAIKKTLEGSFGRVRVRGEVGRVSRPRSGHLYYDIKDEKNVINCSTWKGQVAGLGVVPEEGLEVIVTGRLSSYGPASRYNIIVDRVELAGQGALMAMLEKRRKDLAAEGLFDAERKQKLPLLPNVIGVITSPRGAVIRDILHRLSDRFARPVLVWPVAVQGTKCAQEVSHAIKGFNQLDAASPIPRPDLLIVARGGGSLEDLWGFNEEIVIRAVASSRIPVISAIGHETDTTLVDFAADYRAPTPTAAAERAVPVRVDLLAWVAEQGGRLQRNAAQMLHHRNQRLRDLSRGLPRADTITQEARQRLDLAEARLLPALRHRSQSDLMRLRNATGALRPITVQRLTSTARQRYVTLAQRLRAEAIARQVSQNRARLHESNERLATVRTAFLRQNANELSALARLMESLSYNATLARGYAVVWGDNRVVTSQAKAKAAKRLEIQFADGRFSVNGKAKARNQRDASDGQGSLF